MKSASSVLYVFLFLALLPYSIVGQGNSSFFEDLDATELSSSAESLLITKIIGENRHSSYSFVEIGDITQFLSGDVLSFSFPGKLGTYSYERSMSYTEPNNDYYWFGYDSINNPCMISYRNGQYMATFYFGSERRSIKIISVNNAKSIALERPPKVEFITSCPMAGLDFYDDDDLTSADTRAQCPQNKIRILFLYTTPAINTGLDPNIVASNVINQLNMAARVSNVPSTVSFESAGVEFIDFVQSADIEDDRLEIKNNTDAQQLREDKLGDIVILLGNYSMSDRALGVAVAIAALKNRAYAIAEIDESDDPLEVVAAHEITHLIGGRHQRANLGINCCMGNNDTNNFNWAHGKVKCDDDITTMMVAGDCGEHLVRWSNPDVEINGVKTGGPFSNVAKKIKNRGPKVACFFDAPVGLSNPTGLRIAGPSIIYPEVNNIWSPLINFGNAPYSYKWFKSPSGFSWSQISMSQNLNSNSNDFIEGYSQLKLEVTDANSETKIATLLIFNDDGLPDDGQQLVRPDFGNINIQNNEPVNLFHSSIKIGSAVNSETPFLFPNPIRGTLKIERIESFNELFIYNLHGKLITHRNLVGDKIELDLNNLIPGFYLLKLQNAHAIQTFKILKVND